MSGGTGGVEDERLANQIDGYVVPAGLVSDDAKEVERFGVVGLQAQNLPVKRLGLRQTPCLMMLECQGEGLWNRNR